MKPLLLLITFTLGLWAQPGPGEAIIDRLRRMTPAERQRALNRMPPARRDMLERRLSSLDQIKPETREKLRKDYESFQKLSPERQQEVRRTLREIADLPLDRRRAVRAAIQHLRRQPLEKQQRLLDSSAFSQRFAAPEAKLIRDALSFLPPDEPADTPTIH